MKLPSFLAVMVWSSLHCVAQITVTSGTFPAVGDNLRYVQAANPNTAVALYTPPGGNQNWDLSALKVASTVETQYRPAAEGVSKDAFPGATMVVFKGTEEQYYRSSATKFELLGTAGTSIGGLPLKVVYKNQPVLAERHAPLNFFDIYQQSSSNLIAWKFSEIPTGAFSLPAKPDSIRLRISRQVVEAVDGWGTLRLPGALPQSEFSVLRLKKTTYREQRIDAKIPPLGWLDVTDIVIKGGTSWSPLFGVDTVVTHHYFSNAAKEEIAVLTFNAAQNAVISVVYKNTSTTPVVEASGAALPPLQVYPNPATSAVTIRCPYAPPGIYTLKFFSSLGILLKESTHLLAENIPIQATLPAGINNGLYVCRLEDAKGNTAGLSRLIVRQ